MDDFLHLVTSLRPAGTTTICDWGRAREREFYFIFGWRFSIEFAHHFYLRFYEAPASEKKKLLESLLLRSGVVSLWELLVRKSVIKGKKFYSCGLFAFYHGTNFRILFPRHSKVNKDWMRVRRVVISSFPMFICFFKDFYSTVRSMYIATFKESLKIKYFF